MSQYLQFPPGTTHVYSYFESRGGKFDRTVFFGLQYIIKRWLCGQVVTKEKIAEAKTICKLHFGQDIFNEEGWNYILEVCIIFFLYYNPQICVRIQCMNNSFTILAQGFFGS